MNECECCVNQSLWILDEVYCNGCIICEDYCVCCCVLFGSLCDSDGVIVCNVLMLVVARQLCDGGVQWVVVLVGDMVSVLFLDCCWLVW